MTARELVDQLGYEVLSEGNAMDQPILKPACCDLLSIAMGNLPAGCAWVTVMSNINTLAVASLTEASCVILALKTAVTDEFLEKAAETKITVLRTDQPIFDAAYAIQHLLDAR